MFDDLDPKEFEETAAAVVDACASANDAKARGALLGEAGLIGVTAPEEAGGLGLPLDFAVPVLSAAGAGLLGFPLIEAVLLAKALAPVDADLAGRIASGETLATVAWQGRAEDGLVAAAPLGQEADHVLILRADGSAVLAQTGNAVTARAVPALDVDAPESAFDISGDLTGPVLDAATVATLQREAQVLRTAFVAGSSDKCLSLAADYAQDRSQFGKILAANQVIRHRLSRDKLAVSTMRNGLKRALKADVEDADLAIEATWLGTARAGISVAESAIQVFGGMGFTWEVPLHRHLRQMRAQSAYGAVAQATEGLGDRLIAARTNEWYGEIEHVV
ncbi:acyl-CoA dehydrogenase family protein [Pseudooceanicola nitratireducens]|uniref:acyl-CoA dehydrogenase family protein n=1 Tax=Pseudooceanicola nitratireducens TaxID=517719 RepID=UPI003C7DBD57